MRSLKGIFLTDATNEFTFHHFHGHELAAYALDISIRYLPLRADFLSKTETSLDAATPVNIKNFLFGSSIDMRKPRWWCERVQAKFFRLHHYYGAIGIDSIPPITQINLHDESKFVLLHQQVFYNDLLMSLISWVLQYSNLVDSKGFQYFRRRSEEIERIPALTFRI